MPELKIAAFHDLRKSLAVTLQLAGRFTRAREDLGEPVFIANTADVNLKEELRACMRRTRLEPVAPHLSEGAIGRSSRHSGSWVASSDSWMRSSYRDSAGSQHGGVSHAMRPLDA